MKKFALLLCTILLATGLFGQSLGDQINSLQTQLNAAMQKRGEIQNTVKTLDQKKSDIEFAYGAWQKQSGLLKQEVTDWKMNVDSLGARYAQLQPAADSLKSRLDSHNANRCEAPADNPGACSAYNAEAAQLNSERGSLESQYAPLDSQKSQLQSQQESINTRADQLDQIIQTVSEQTQEWTAAAKQLMADNADNEANIAKLQADLETLQSQWRQCHDSIPKECDSPFATNPDGTPKLNGKCEEMHRVCGEIFDGNR